jgi:hypothetical protein
VASTQDDVVVRLRLKDVRQFIADVKAGKLAIEDLEKQVRQAGRTAASASAPSGGFGKLASHFGFLKYAAVGVVGSMAAAGAGVVGYAVKSAASLEQMNIAFTTMLGSAKAAKSMVASLQTFAQVTPFNLSDVQDATQHLLAFKFSAQSVIPTLTAVGDAVSGLNLGPEGFQRIILALGQMKSMTTVQGGEVLQLEQAGINVRSYLEKALHLTPKQLQDAMRKNSISANTAIPIILAGMEKDYKGLMDKEAHSLTGMWSNFHDAIQQGLIKLANPFMPALKHWLGEATTYLGGPDGKSGLFARLSKFSAVLPGNVMSGRADFAAYNIGAIIGNHGFDPAIEKGVRVVHNLGVIVKDVLVPSLRDFSMLLGPLVLLMENLDSITGFVADHSTAFHVALDLVVGSLLVYKGLMIAMAAAGGVLAAYDAVMDISKIKTLGFRDATNRQRLAIVAWKIAVWAATGAQWLWNAAMDANPVGLIILAIAGIGTALYLAYENIKPFRDYVNGLWDDMRGFAEWIEGAWNVTVGNMGAPKFRNSDGTPVSPTTAGAAAGATVAQWWLNPVGAVAGLVGGAIADHIPGHASGGTVTQGHAAWVGERGPELVNLPRGSQVIPLPRVGEFAGRGPVHVHVDLNGREIARAVYDDMDDRMARR